MMFRESVNKLHPTTSAVLILSSTSLLSTSVTHSVDTRRDKHHFIMHDCASGQLEIVQYFHSKKLSDLVHKAHSGDTPLHFACKYNHVEVVQFLLSTGEFDPDCLQWRSQHHQKSENCLTIFAKEHILLSQLSKCLF